MARRKQSRGNCEFCGRNMSKSGLSKHLKSCEKRLETLDAANSKKSGKEETFYHLQIQDAWQGDYWLHLEMSGKATLEDLDDYLRAIWLECCGHMSEFSIGRWTGNTISLNKKADKVFSVGMEIDHVYDFGTSSETKIKVVDVRKGKSITKYPIKLMARNESPQFPCVECEKPASWICIECIYEDESEGTLCETHAENHPHDDYGEPLPLVNSPRVGMCAYEGPADPPY